MCENNIRSFARSTWIRNISIERFREILLLKFLLCFLGRPNVVTYEMGKNGSTFSSLFCYQSDTIRIKLHIIIIIWSVVWLLLGCWLLIVCSPLSWDTQPKVNVLFFEFCVILLSVKSTSHAGICDVLNFKNQIHISSF